MSAGASLRVGDRVLMRDRTWRVTAQRSIAESTVTLELEALDREPPARLSVVSPPEEVMPVPSETVCFDPTALDAFGPWARAHALLGATLVQESSVLTGARFGRVQLEAYQLAPALRMLSKPRPSLLLADDVGLGKTVMGGLAVLELMARGRAGRVLIVAPPGLVLQWRAELQERLGLDFVLIENAAGLARVQSELPAGANPWDVLPRVLTSIDYLKKETVRSRALRKPWDLVLVDEAHALAESGTPDNPYRTQRTRLGLALRDATRGLLLLTATPHNGYVHSFRSLLELVEPTGATLHGKEVDLRRRVSAAMVRRLKPQITRQLPDGRREPVFPGRKVQGIAVERLGGYEHVLHKVAAYCSRTARSAKGTEDEDLVTFAMQIVKKRALSSRAALEKTLENRLDALKKLKDDAPPRPEPSEVRDLQADLPLDEATAERTAQRIVQAAISKEEKQRQAEVKALNAIKKVLKAAPAGDPKVKALLAEVRAILGKGPDERVIVFTEYLDTLEAIQAAVDSAKDLAGGAVVLRGGMSARARARVQEQFEQSGVRLLLATDAASEGLNLQRACHRIIHVELPWNPNRLEQRNGRVDRYGQTKPPEIRYLYFPDSPEDDVLNRLVARIEQIGHDQVSTPDILGVLRGATQIDAGLVELDPEGPDVERRKVDLVKIFEDRTADFVRNVRPLVAPVDPGDREAATIIEHLSSSHILLPDDERLEALVLASLGEGRVRSTDAEGVFRLDVPLAFRGPSVAPVYPRATFRRSVAVRHRAADVEFITPLHPLVQSLAADARRRLAQVYPDVRGLPPRRVAARAVAKAEHPSVVFTFLGVISGGRGLLEERIIAVQVGSDGDVLSRGEAALRWLGSPDGDREVSRDALSRVFSKPFDRLAAVAVEAAREELASRARELGAHRAKQAQLLREDLERDLQDRLEEIESAERLSRGLVDTNGGAKQGLLFPDAAPKGKTAGFGARRVAADTSAQARREELAAFEQVDAPELPRPLGALLLLPGGTP